MSEPLPALRGDLDLMPSPIEDRPGLLIRDSFRYSDAVLIVPPVLVPCLSCFDGEQTPSHLRARLEEMTGDSDVSELEAHLVDALSRSGFLHDENYQQLKEAAHARFVKALVREPAHAGSGYPADAGELRTAIDEWMAPSSSQAHEANLSAIAAPHVSPIGGYTSYRAAYRRLAPQYRDRTFVILGTSHYGEANTFGLTRKPYITPFGATRATTSLVDELAAAARDAVRMEDYCHAVEHSIEFQVVFLQSIFGPDIQILPILCGSYTRSIYQGGLPEKDPAVDRFLNTLGEIGARESGKLLWVLGIDMAHMGRRYGDPLPARAHQSEMLDVEARDKARIQCINSGDVRGFWERVQENRDPLKWCGSSPVYTFMKVQPQARGFLESYEQWNIDEQSVVSFAGLTFR